MKNQLLEDMNVEPLLAPVIEVCFAHQGALCGWGTVHYDGDDQWIFIDNNKIIPLESASIYEIRIKK